MRLGIGIEIPTLNQVGAVLSGTAAFFEDTFDESSLTNLTLHTPDTGDGWDEISNNSGLVLQVAASSAGYCSGSGGTALGDHILMGANVTYPSANYSVQCDVIQNVVVADAPAFVTARALNLSNVYWAGLFRAAEATDIVLGKLSSGVRSTLDSDNLDLDTTATKTLKLTVDGTSLSFYVDGTLRLSATDSDLTAAGQGGIALGELPNTNNDVSSEWRFSNFSITEV